MVLNKLKYLLILIPMLFLMSACTVSYSFSGSSLDYTKVKTVSIANFPNRASLVYPALAPTFTEQLKETFSSKTSLNQVPKNGDLQISGEFTGYSLSPSAINSSGSSTMTRLTVVVKVVFVNRSNESENFERSFSSYQEFSNTQTINQVQEELCETIIEELIDQIFNATVANW